MSIAQWATSSSNAQMQKGILYTLDSARYYPISNFSNTTDVYLIDRYFLIETENSKTSYNLVPLLTNFYFCNLKDTEKTSYELTEIAGTVNIEKTKKIKDIDFNMQEIFFYNILLFSERSFVDSSNEVVVQGLQIQITDDEALLDYFATGVSSSIISTDYALYSLSLEKSCAKITNIKFYKELTHEITKKEVYGTGIGFTSILYDNKNNVVRYGLDSGFYLDFDKDGNLLSTQGKQGATGPRGEKGDKGNTGEKGTSITKVEQTETSSLPSGKNKLTITLSDGTQSEFVVTNGAVGDESLILTDDDFAEIIS